MGADAVIAEGMKLEVTLVSGDHDTWISSVVEAVSIPVVVLENCVMVPVLQLSLC